MRFLLPGAALASLLLAGCGGGAKHHETRVIVLGIDGLDPEMVQERIDRGELPSFAKLVESGTFRALQTSWPPQSPVAWSNFITGTNPGKHGLYDFIHVDRHNYGIQSSMSSTDPVGMELSLFGYKLPLTGGDQHLTRAFPAWWEVMDEAGVPAAVWRMPANFPSEPTGALTFPDMGTPDLVGAASGKSYLWTGDPTKDSQTTDSTYVVKIEPFDGRTGLRTFGGRLYGPPNTMLDQSDLEAEIAKAEEAGDADRASTLRGKHAAAQETFTPFKAYVDLHGDETRLAIRIDDTDDWALAREGGWSNWVPVDITMISPIVTISGYTRFLFKSADPLEVYASPIQIDPFNPAMPVSTPEDASAWLAGEIGPYYTQGFPDAYKSYKVGLLTTPEFVSQSDTVLEERERMMEVALDRFAATGGALFFYYGCVDMRCHMLWHCQDREHPHQEEDGRDYEEEIDRVYRQMDAVLGRLLERMEAWPDAELVVMSDHGFAPFRRAMHVNDWLLSEGYLVLKEGVYHADGKWWREREGEEEPEKLGGSLRIWTSATTAGGEPDWSASPVDWSRSRAYCIGFNGVILNRAGREPRGIVSEAEAGPLLAEIADQLLALRDGDTPVFTRVPPATEVFSGAMLEHAPDLQLGFNVGYGASDPCATGEITGEGVLVDNDSRWSGSHLMDPELVRGTIITSGRHEFSKDPALEDITATLYRLFDVPPPAGLDGKALF